MLSRLVILFVLWLLATGRLAEYLALAWGSFGDVQLEQQDDSAAVPLLPGLQRA